jgi:uncharacterized protein YjbI with pentapeptide repeats
MSVSSRPSNGNGESHNGDDAGTDRWKLVPPAAGASGGDSSSTEVDDDAVTVEPEQAAQPTAQLTGDGTLPIEIVDPDAPALIIDERGLPESVSGELPRVTTPATGTPSSGGGQSSGAHPPPHPTGASGVQAPPPLPLPASAPRARVRARSAGERGGGGGSPVASTPAPLHREQVLEKLRRGETLRGLSLRGVDLSGAKLGPADLTRADLERADLRGVYLEKANLRGASLRGARLNDADLRGANLESADLSDADLRQAIMIQANLTLARVEDADLTAANLAGADLSLAQLRSCKLAGANLKDATFTHAHLVRATLTGVKALGADFVDADLRGAVLAEGDFTGAEFTEARMAGVDARRARLGGVSLVDADLRRADLSRADLSHADLRRANLTQGVLAGASFTGAKIEGMTPAGAPAEGLLAGWVDVSPAADGSHRLDGLAALAAITGAARDAIPPEERRYFGRSDVVRNATFDFGNNARVEIDSRLEGCTITLGPGAELVVGQAGALLDCQVKGGARLIVHGRVFEREAPAIQGTGAILIGATGSLQGTVAQAPGGTRFGFERGCKLRLAIGKAPAGAADAGDSEPGDGRVRDRMPVMPSSGIATGSDATTVGVGARFTGKLATAGDILVRGEVEGELEGRRIEVDERGSVSGRMKATELKAWGASAGTLEGDTVELGGQLKDGAVVKAGTLVVRWDERATATPVRFGQVTLEVGAAPSRDEPAAVPSGPLSEPETKPSSALESATDLPAVDEPVIEGKPGDAETASAEAPATPETAEAGAGQADAAGAAPPAAEKKKGKRRKKGEAGVEAAGDDEAAGDEGDEGEDDAKS